MLHKQKKHILKITCLVALIFISTISTYANSKISKKDTIYKTTSRDIVLERISVLSKKDDIVSINAAASERFSNHFIDHKKAGKLFKETQNEFINFWGKLTIQNKSKISSKFILLDNATQMGRKIELYSKNQQNWVKLKSINGINKAFILRIPFNDSKTYYFKCKSFGYKIDFDIFSTITYIKHNKSRYLFYGLFIGVVIIMAFYNFFLFITFRDTSYIYYIAFIFSFCLLQTMLNGIFFEFFPMINAQYDSFWYIRSLTVVTFGLFSTNLLSSKQYTPRLHKIINVNVITILFLTVIFSIVELNIAEILINLPYLAIFISILVLAIISLKNKYHPAKYFIVATSSIIITGFLYPISYAEWAPFNINDLVKYKIMDLAGLFMVFLFSIALADRINIIKKEKADAQTEAFENLKKADKLKDEFLSNTSHELQTPLNGIIGMTESLIGGLRGPLPDAAMRDLEIVTASGKRLSNLVNDILDFSLLKNKDIKLQMRPVDIHGIAEIVITVTQHLTGDRDLKLINSVPENFPPLRGDENRIQQILYNLVGNAIKFTSEGIIEVSAEIKNNIAHITVSDTGIGIDEDKLSKIFNPFEQADGTISRLYGGTGIGLTITRYLVELHSGTMNVRSLVDQGSGFSFTIPLYKTDAMSEEDTAEISKASIQAAVSKVHAPHIPLSSIEKNKFSSDKPSVLIVDDDNINLQVLENILSLENYTILKASNGKQALDMIETNIPDLILLDIMMPGMSGYEVSHIVREKFSLFEMPILMLTAKTRISDMVEGFEAGANDYLPKPFDRTELLARVQTLLTLKKTVKESQMVLMYEQQLNFARNIQMSSIPGELPVSPFFELGACYVPTDRVGGDYYNFHHIDEKNIGLFISDVSGHGVPAAMITSMVKIVFNLLKDLYNEPADLVHEMKHMLTGNIEKQFITAAYAYINLEKRTLSLARAGHEPLLIFNKYTKKIQQYLPKGAVIGYFLEKEYKEIEIDIEEGDRIILYTDCVTEALREDDINNEMFGLDRFFELITNTSEKSPQEFVDAVQETLNEWIGTSSEYEDDLTIVVLDVTGEVS